MSLILALAMVISMSGAAISSSAAETLPGVSKTKAEIARSGDILTYGDYEYEIADDETVFIVGYRGSDVSIVLPSEINGKAVTTIGDDAFDGCTSLNNVQLSNSITNIPHRTFYNCTSLASINVPDGVKWIGDNAFAGCTSLASVELPTSLSTINDSAFSDCSSLTSVEIPSSVTDIAYAVFSGCTQLTSINVDPQNETYCSVDGVVYNKDVTNIVIWPCGKELTAFPDSVTSIGNYAFSYCTNLTSITIPDNINNIGYRAFLACENLAKIEIPETVTVIDDGAFYYCESLTDIKLPNAITFIGDDTFNNCENLTNIWFPKSVTRVGKRAFEDCVNLSDVYYTGNKTEWNNIDIEIELDGDYGECLTGATIHFNSSEEFDSDTPDTPDTATDTDTETDTVTESDTDTETQTDTATESDTDTETQTDTATESDTDTETQTDTDTETENDKAFTYYFLAPDNWFDTEKGAYNEFVGCYWVMPNEPAEYPGIKMTSAPEVGDNVFKVEGVSSDNSIIIFNAYLNVYSVTDPKMPYAYETWNINLEGYETGDCPYDPSLTTDNFDGWIFVLKVDPNRYDFDRPLCPRYYGAWFKLDDYKNYADYYGTYSFTDTDIVNTPDTPDTPDPEKPTTKTGDVDGDGKISAKDSMNIQRYVISLKKLDDNQLKAADVNGDGRVTNKDALSILRYTIGYKVEGLS